MRHEAVGEEMRHEGRKSTCGAEMCHEARKKHQRRGDAPRGETPVGWNALSGDRMPVGRKCFCGMKCTYGEEKHLWRGKAPVGDEMPAGIAE